MFLFNDLIIVTKPRAGYHPTAETAAIPAPAAAERFQYRYSFNMVAMKLVDKSNNAFHAHVLELANPNGRLITLSFGSAEEKSRFHAMLSELIEDVAIEQEDKRHRIQKLTETKVATAKILLEEAYAIQATTAIPSTTNTTTTSATAATTNPDTINTTANRYINKYGSLRGARLALQTQTSFMFGGKKLAANGKEKPKHTEKLIDFRATVRLDAPSPSPDIIVAPQPTTTTADNEIIVTIEEESPSESAPTSPEHADPSSPAKSDPIATLSLSPLPNRLRKRRHTSASVKGRKSLHSS